MTAAVGVAKDPKHQNHEEIFLERYTRLLQWASQLTNPDRELAKDLVQDAFLHFTLSARDLVTINNIDKYLYGVVRNTYLSHLRRSSRQQHEPLPTFDLGAPGNLMLTVDPRRQIHAQDELRAICHHACARKEASITGSVLILRFFHGYVPSEVARLIHSSRNIVDVQLRSARAEAIACLGNPSSASVKRNSLLRLRPKSRIQLATDLLTELREVIFATRRGGCFNSQQLKEIYRTQKALNRATLSHLVSCPRCLDEANKLLGLSPLRERDAIDVLGRTSDNGGMNALYSLPH